MERIKSEIARLSKPQKPIKTTLSVMGIAAVSAGAIMMIDTCIGWLVKLII